jgi:hypothetical protein
VVGRARRHTKGIGEMRIDIKVRMGQPKQTELRSWALHHGHYVAEHGPIPWEVRQAFQSALVETVKKAGEDFLAEFSTVEVAARVA